LYEKKEDLKLKHTSSYNGNEENIDPSAIRDDRETSSVGFKSMCLGLTSALKYLLFITGNLSFMEESALVLTDAVDKDKSLVLSAFAECFAEPFTFLNL
jgi:hypothetical protein